MTLASPPIFGRSSEMSALNSLVDRVTKGAAEVGVIEGIAGIGKTRLLQAAAAYADERGLRVLRGAADELERDRPFRAVADALALDQGSGGRGQLEIHRLLTGDVGPRLGGRSQDEGSDISYRIVDSVVDLLEQWCIETPVLLCLEDLHWADPSTLQAVRLIAKRLSKSAFGLFVTLRPSPTMAELALAVADLLGRGGHHFVLSPLDKEASSSLAQEILSAELGPNLREQVAAAGGTPLFVIEVLEALREEGAIEFVDGRAEVDQISIPPSLRLTILRRLSFLPEETLDLLKMASILGRSFTLADLGRVTSRSSVEVLSLLKEALRAGVIGEAQDRLAFRHDLIREAIYEELPASVRQDLHREAGRALAGENAPPAQVAEQMSLGASVGDTEAVGWLRRAAEQAASRSAPSAVRLLERAIELTDPADQTYRELSSDLVLPLLMVGRLAEAEARVRELLPDETQIAAKIALQRILVAIMFFRGDRRGARDLSRSNARSSEASDDERSADLAVASLIAVYVADLESAKELGVQGRVLGDASGNAFATALSLTALSTVARLQGSARHAVDLGSEAVEFSRRAQGPWADFFVTPWATLGAAHLEADRLDDAETALRTGLDVGHGIVWAASWSQMFLAAKAFLAGEWDDAVAEAQAGLSLVDDLEFTPFGAVLLPLGLIAAIATYRGDWESARTALTRADDELAKSGPEFGVDLIMWVKGLLNEAEGADDEARTLLDGAWNINTRFGFQLSHRWVAPDLVRLTIERGDTAGAESVAVALEDLAAREDVPSAQGVALRCRGLVEDDAQMLVASVEAYRKSPRPFERALACEDAAVALARSNRAEEARSFLDEALEVYERVGAIRLIDRAQAAVRPFGLRLGKRGKRRRPSSGWDSLTPTELRVVELVAKRLTNREIGERLFISPRTVETHVTHLFAKLDVSSRRELGAVATRHLGHDL